MEKSIKSDYSQQDLKNPQDQHNTETAQTALPAEKSIFRDMDTDDDSSTIASHDAEDSDSVETKHPYTIYNINCLHIMLALVSFAGTMSSISGPIYFPALTELQVYFNVTTEQINISVVVYSIFQGIGPAIWGTVSDIIGRRPVYIVCLAIYLGSNIGLALTRWYWLLLVMRCIQAIGISAALALGSGVLSDLTERRNRGGYMGYFTGFTLLGNCFGPLIGGGLTQSLGWRSMFWFLAIYSGSTMVVFMLVFPETKRSMCANGSVVPKRWYNIAPTLHLGPLKSYLVTEPDEELKEEMKKATRKINPFQTFMLAKEIEVLMILIPNAMFYTAWFMALTAQSTKLSSEYGFSTVKIGLSYLSNGAGCVVGSIASGKLMNLYYAILHKKYMGALPKGAAPNPAHFPIHRARLLLTFFFCLGQVVATIIFGWTIQYKVHYIVPILSVFLMSLASTSFLNCSSTLLVDLFPTESASAAGCVNLTRCLTAAVGIAVQDKMMTAMGVGGCFTLVAGLCALSYGCVGVALKMGPRWSAKRFQKSNEKLKAELEIVNDAIAGVVAENDEKRL
ncbi:MFS general substrate transporter [Nadsonia fulvescens var. elongata DSM 6958]|uniref:MFS general substrate transporter n=1 Tax=Nadsonia fulvescens var. elongata DSM 6958 TaxID=857566 RepID=A0A1E3PGV9_9ASCO|nr:MFS general substrate transporter [Nadsonia fulvescens var. elongata DSM 6958]